MPSKGKKIKMAQLKWSSFSRVYRDRKLLSTSQLEKEYQDWILQTQVKRGEESDHGEV